MIESIITRATELNVSDIHIVYGIPIRFRIDGQLTDMDDHIVTEEECNAYAADFGEEAVNTARTVGEADLAVTISGRRLRVNLFKQQDHFSLAIRLLSSSIPKFEDLKLPPIVATFSEFKNGLVLVTGETGSGKSTTLASLLNMINMRDHKHIITLEDPIEYVYKPDKCTINQREIGRDTQSFANGLRAALREDPDVILVGEMRDFETISVAITAAETGHLVLSTLHTIGAASTVDRVIDVFPPHQQQQIRVQLSNVLEAVISQQLIPTSDGMGRVAAFEVMHANHAVRNLIREGKSHQLTSVMQTNRKLGMITMDEAIQQLYYNGSISRDMAIQFAQDPDAMETKI